MAKEKSEPKVDMYGLTPEQFAEWELLECNLEIYLKSKGLPSKKVEVPKEVPTEEPKKKD